MQAKILTVGDVVGGAGLDCLTRRLRAVQKQTGAAFTVVNGENVSGTGLTPRQAEAILSAGADVITLGNHAFARQEILPYLDDCQSILRPANYAPQTPGRGWGLFPAPFGEVLVMCLQGRLGMDFGPDNPFLEAERILKKNAGGPRVILAEIHAEATSEKQAMAWHLDGRASCVWGTHCHVQTSDACVLPGGTGTVTDVGMTGPVWSVLGVKPEQSVSRFLGNPRQKYETADGPTKLECAVFTVDTLTGRCLAAQTLREGC
jgi:metallophosphoesterase (TIGR00282 family)